MPTTTQGQLMQQLLELTDAVKDLAQRPVEIVVAATEPATDVDRIRQRTSFSYQALGTLTGRVSRTSGREFDVPVVRALRRRGQIGLDDLPPGADWVELRTGDRLEVLRIHREFDDDLFPVPAPTPVPPQGPGLRGRRRHGGRGVVRPRLFDDTDPIGSIVVLRDKDGPLLAFGPRLAPLEPNLDRQEQ